ncbi:MAG TPA: glycoside hydrolase family 36 protein [Bacteroidia bacterium]|nr:glycoside hydrolase family 36 protein [Bacteroidia bacterium]
MEESFVGHIAWYQGSRLMEAEFHQGAQILAGGLAVVLDLNREGKGIQIQIGISSRQEVLLKDLYIELVQPVAPTDTIFLNGYQSWTESRLFSPDESIPKLTGPIKGMLNTTGDYTFYNNPHKEGYLHAWSFTSLGMADGKTRFWMEAATETGYTIFEWRCKEGRLRLRKDVGGRTLLGEAELLRVNLWEEDGTESTVPLPACAKAVKAPATGWTSWYNYYTKITEGIILDNLRAYGFREMPIDFFQIDDGWQPAVGDWTSANKKFPQGMAFLADQIHRYGYKAGLWLAPLIVEQDSAIYQTHRDWLVTHDGERLVEAGYNPGWGGLFNGTYYLLDLELPAVRDHLRHVFDVVLNQWGYDLVKLDFLFAAALIPRNGKSRGQLMWEACRFLRECCGEKLILGCGVPLAPAWNVFDYCRIGPDIGLNWEMRSGKMIHMRERISTHNALHNTVSRRHFSGHFFANDPDVFILRKNDNELSPQQRFSLLAINQIFGDLLFTSDNIGGYDAATMALYRSTFPVLRHSITRVEQDGELYRIWFEALDSGNAIVRRYFAAANLSREDHRIALPEGVWYRNGEGFVEEPKAVYFKPFETRIYLAQSARVPGIAGSDLHLFPGCEVVELAPTGDGIRLKLSPQTVGSGNLVLRVAADLAAAKINGRDYPTYKGKGATLAMVPVKDGKLV